MGRQRQRSFGSATTAPSGRLRRVVERFCAMAVLVAGLTSALGIAGCASTEPADDVDAPANAIAVPVDELASSLGLEAKSMDHRRRVIIQPTWGGDRILLFPGTTTVTVRGARYTAQRAPWNTGGQLWLDSRDVRAIQTMWRESTPLGRPSRPGPRAATGGAAPRSGVSRLPPKLPTSQRPDTDSTASAGQLSARERRDWAVPLRRDWRYIVVHHSATPSGSAASFHAAHLKRGWDGLGYHFVIGNGRGMGDGEVQSGFRWPRQREGAHAGSDLFNQHGIGICLVGDLSTTKPTRRQMAALQRLSDFLSMYCRISPENLRLHRDFRKTECPGRFFPRSFRFAGASAH